MKKTNATLMLIAMLVLTGVCWFAAINKQISDKNIYSDTIHQAEGMLKKGIYQDALELYMDIESLFGPNYSLVMKIADAYRQMGDEDGFLAYCDKAIALDEKCEEAYVKKANYYIENQKFSSAIQVVNSGLQNVKESETLTSISQQLVYKYRRIEKHFSTVMGWHTQIDSAYMVAERSGNLCLFVSDGTVYAENVYDELGAYDNETGVMPCCYEGQYFYIDSNGNRKLVPDKEYEYLGAFGQGLASAKSQGKYGYIDTDFQEYAFEYEYTGGFCNGVAAVKKNGKWALINTKMELLTDFIYDNILLNEYGFCSAYSRIWAQRDGHYILLDTSGVQVTETAFEDVRLPASSDGAIAVKKGDKWGFIDTSGEMVIEAKYEDADSFAIGLAPIKQGGSWQYINTDEKIVIEEQFNMAKPFSGDGVASVYNGSYWYMIILSRYDN